MARLVILRPEENSGDLLVTRRARLRERIAARWRAHASSTRSSQRGVAPEAGAALALRAHDLGEPRIRLALARGVQRALDEARSPRRPSRSRIPVSKAEVMAAADELDELAKRLRSQGLLASRGLASVHLLLTDGRSPLYLRGTTGKLRVTVSPALRSAGADHRVVIAHCARHAQATRVSPARDPGDRRAQHRSGEDRTRVWR